MLLTVVDACYPHLSVDICSSSWNLAEEKEELYERFSSGRDFLVTCWVSVLPLLLQDEIAASIITAVNKLSLFTFAYVPIFSDALFHINDYICNIIAFFNTQINLFQSDFSTKFAQSFAFPASSKLYHE